MESAQSLRDYFLRPIPNDPIYHARIEEEFALIDRNGFTRVFHQVQRSMELCEELHIPHIIRGSAGSSLVCFLMGISHTDPIQYGMDLTRFMNHGRTDMPDIDIDIPYNRRDELYARIGQEWPKQVARISNHVMYKYKSALQDAMRAVVPKIRYRKGVPLEQMVTDPEVVARIRTLLYDKLGTLRTESLHCGGIVIFDKEGGIPPELILKTDGILPQITLNKDETEDAGYIKIDLLSNRGLAQWRDASSVQSLLDYPARDDSVARLFSTGNTIGITFAESRGMRHIFRQLMPTSIEEIAIALALIRPAAAAGGRKAAFLTGHRTGKEYTDLDTPIVYDDDALRRIRAVFQTSNMDKNAIDALADQFRKAFSKQRIADCLRFRDICRLQTIPEPTLTALMEDLHQLQHYSFCKSHALSYAQLVWALAYEKVHSPETFWLSTLNHCHSDYRTWVHFREARRAGLSLPRGKRPYTRIGSRIVSTTGEQMTLLPEDHPTQQYSDMKQLGYWRSASFFPGCYKRIEHVTKSEKKTVVHFCGLLATGRIVRSETDGEESYPTQSTLTFLCIGVDNGDFLDLVVKGGKGHLLGYAAVEGKGILRNDTVDVQTIRPMRLSALSSSSAHCTLSKSPGPS